MLAVGCAAVPVAAQSTPAPYATVMLAPAQLAADIALLRQALEQVHAGYDRYTPRRVPDTAFARLTRRAPWRR